MSHSRNLPLTNEELETMLQELLPRDLTAKQTMQDRQDFLKRGRVLEEKLENSMSGTLSGSFADLLFLPDFSVQMSDDSAASASAPCGAPDVLRNISDEDVIDVFGPDLFLKHYPGSSYTVEKFTHFPGYVHFVRLSTTIPEGKKGVHEKGKVEISAAATVHKPETKTLTASGHYDHDVTVVSNSTIHDVETFTPKAPRNRTPKLMSAANGQEELSKDQQLIIEASNEEERAQQLAVQDQNEDGEGNCLKLLEQTDTNASASSQSQGDNHDRINSTREIIKSSTFHQVSRGHFDCLDNPCKYCEAADLQGAAIQQSGSPNFDVVSALMLHHWPEHASTSSSIIRRKHPSGWPDQELVKKLGETRLLLVPKPHPLATDKEKEEMWRFSFSFVESELANALPESARQTYLTVKFLVKVFREKASSHLKTYHLKTTLFWLMSIEPMAGWKVRSLTQNVDLLLASLRDAFRSRSLRNFFVPESNIIVGYMSETESKAVAFCAEELRNSLAEKLTGLKGRVRFIDYRKEELSDASASTARVLFRESLKASDENTRHSLVNTAKEFYQEALKTNPFNYKAGLELGMLFQRIGNHLVAQKLFATAKESSTQQNVLKAEHGYRTTYSKFISFNQENFDILDENLKTEVTHRYNHEVVHHVGAVADYFLMLAKTPEAAFRDAKSVKKEIEDGENDMYNDNLDYVNKHGFVSGVLGNLKRNSFASSRASLLGYVFRAKGYHEEAKDTFLFSFVLDWTNKAAWVNMETEDKTMEMRQLVATFSAQLP